MRGREARSPARKRGPHKEEERAAKKSRRRKATDRERIIVTRECSQTFGTSLQALRRHGYLSSVFPVSKGGMILFRR
ncbi:hypothetical protein R1sor_018181 [Riccia sorocarpa]|uniref:Uncharacterized protein n=1 Tax=Riccia sorocarpa TaxID=122646 RepID=A0ABD3IF57_9MARC